MSLKCGEMRKERFMEMLGAILASVFALVLAIIFGWMTGSVGVGIVVFIIGAGYLFGEWMKAGVPYDINEIKRKMK